VALFTTDLSLSVQQIIEYCGARWKIESGFKEIKQEIGSAKSQVRNAFAVTNHSHFCMVAATLTWIYADRIQADPERRHKVQRTNRVCLFRCAQTDGRGGIGSGFPEGLPEA